MSVTLADLIAEVQDFLSAHGEDRDKVTTLTGSGLSPSATSFTVADAKVVDRGLLEIDYELMMVDSKDLTSNTVNLYPWGRGQRATAGAVHSAGSMVSVNPRFPRSRIRTEINTAISNMFPDVFSTGIDTSNTVNSSVVTYPLPQAAEAVLKVGIQAIGPSKMWLPTSGIRFDYTADPTAFPTGRSFDLLQHRAQSGRTIQVVYMAGFGTLNLDTDTLASVGVDESWRDLITLQVCSKLVLGLDPVKLQASTIEQVSRTTATQPTQATSIAKQLMAVYAGRLAQERSLLLQRYPSRVMHTD